MCCADAVIGHTEEQNVEKENFVSRSPRKKYNQKSNRARILNGEQARLLVLVLVRIPNLDLDPFLAARGRSRPIGPHERTGGALDGRKVEGRVSLESHADRVAHGNPILLAKLHLVAMDRARRSLQDGNEDGVGARLDVEKSAVRKWLLDGLGVLEIVAHVILHDEGSSVRYFRPLFFRVSAYEVKILGADGDDKFLGRCTQGSQTARRLLGDTLERVVKDLTLFVPNNG